MARPNRVHPGLPAPSPVDVGLPTPAAPHDGPEGEPEEPEVTLPNNTVERGDPNDHQSDQVEHQQGDDHPLTN